MLAKQPRRGRRRREVLHVALAGGLQVDQHRRLVGKLVEALEVELQAEPAGDRGKVDDGVGRAADRQQRPHRVVDAPLRDDPVEGPPDPMRSTAPAGRLGGTQPVGMHGRDRGGAGQHQPSASIRIAMVEAVPITAQVPSAVPKRPSIVSISSGSMRRRGTSPRSAGSRCRRRAARPW